MLLIRELTKVLCHCCAEFLDSSLESQLKQPCYGMVMVWYGYGMVMVWLWYGYGMVMVWSWYGYGHGHGMAAARAVEQSHPPSSSSLIVTC